MKTKMPLIGPDPQGFNSDYDPFDAGYAAGLKEGQRRERRALKRGLLRDAGWKFTHDPRFHDWLDAWLASRKRKGGKNNAP